MSARVSSCHLFFSGPRGVIFGGSDVSIEKVRILRVVYFRSTPPAQFSVTKMKVCRNSDPKNGINNNPGGDWHLGWGVVPRYIYLHLPLKKSQMWVDIPYMDEMG